MTEQRYGADRQVITQLRTCSGRTRRAPSLHVDELHFAVLSQFPEKNSSCVRVVAPNER